MSEFGAYESSAFCISPSLGARHRGHLGVKLVIIVPPFHTELLPGSHLEVLLGLLSYLLMRLSSADGARMHDPSRGHSEFHTVSNE